MNEATNEMTDRFYKSEVKLEEKKDCSTHGCADLRVIREMNKNIVEMEFAPEPLHMLDARKSGLKFTVGMKYPVKNRKNEYDWKDKLNDMTQYSFQTIDDTGNTVRVDEKYFIPASVKLIGGFIAEDAQFGDQPDIRKVAKEKNIGDLDVSYLEGINEEILVLSGESDSKNGLPPFWMPLASSEPKKNEPWFPHQNINEGVVKDTGNDLLDDATACMAAVDRVFGYNRFVDPNGLIESIKKYCPKLILQWEDHSLNVNGAKTKISYDQVQKAYDGLRALVSDKAAEKAVGKLVASKLKKLF